MESLADLANGHKFIEVSSAKILCLILYNIINIQVNFANCGLAVNSQKFVPTKVSLYVVLVAAAQPDAT